MANSEILRTPTTTTVATYRNDLRMYTFLRVDTRVWTLCETMASVTEFVQWPLKRHWILEFRPIPAPFRGKGESAS